MGSPGFLISERIQQTWEKISERQ